MSAFACSELSAEAAVLVWGARAPSGPTLRLTVKAVCKAERSPRPPSGAEATPSTEPASSNAMQA
eukprot:CAMPEP_0115353536 /NCGR_PEP_ID=MMETSP0270-20121206/98090_1 /TAXON_ID=71861 /ORGANISM="Scrippsiella trochoidea, Strain CCMP3099" /LENGTH=64 /DNA_ID=CAMNT_0002775779 /DNA_START=15 /DNA_END=205 /DNA_ORIENTATION=+